MNRLQTFMREFELLGMSREETPAVASDNGLEFPNDDTMTGDEPEYELDELGNVMLDAEGNPVPKIVDAEVPLEPGTGGESPCAVPYGSPEDGQLPPGQPDIPEDEFVFDF